MLAQRAKEPAGLLNSRRFSFSTGFGVIVSHTLRCAPSKSVIEMSAIVSARVRESELLGPALLALRDAAFAPLRAAKSA